MHMISIITACYNSESTIAATIKSVAKQKSNQMQYIVIDGGSTDNSLNIIEEYKGIVDDVISEPDMGIYDAWNKGLLLSRGEYVAFLGADDLLCENYFDSYIQVLESVPKFEFISSKMLIRKNGKKIGSMYR